MWEERGFKGRETEEISVQLANYVWEPPPSVWWEMRGHALLLGLTEGPAAARGHTEAGVHGL